jgi:hypothetical protein
METKWYLPVVVIALNAGVSHAQQPSARTQDTQESLSQRILRASEADQLAYFNLRLNQGLRPVDDDAAGSLALGRSSVFLPILERKIEEVLRSGRPQDCFTDKDADPKYFVGAGASWIAAPGDEYAMKEIAKLVAIDEQRFGRLVTGVLYSAQNRRNPFAVAYKGLDIGDAKVDKRIVAWAEEELEDKTEFWQGQLRHWWAEAMVEKYGEVPLEDKWAEDPIASRLDRKITDSLHDDVLRLAVEVREKQSKK